MAVAGREPLLDEAGMGVCCVFGGFGREVMVRMVMQRLARPGNGNQVAGKTAINAFLLCACCMGA